MDFLLLISILLFSIETPASLAWKLLLIR